jgi:hypothetical protein
MSWYVFTKLLGRAKQRQQRLHPITHRLTLTETLITFPRHPVGLESLISCYLDVHPRMTAEQNNLKNAGFPSFRSGFPAPRTHTSVPSTSNQSNHRITKRAKNPSPRRTSCYDSARDDGADRVKTMCWSPVGGSTLRCLESEVRKKGVFWGRAERTE